MQTLLRGLVAEPALHEHAGAAPLEVNFIRLGKLGSDTSVVKASGNARPAIGGEEMSNFPIFGAGIFVLLIFGLITSGVWKTENSDAFPIRRMCEAENVTDVQIRECTIRQTVEARMAQR
ncbi:hypothetical protein [Bradyrhizobium sp. CB1015]|uniref:hypothetical protein n=1 Tax=Bradyrhizobium sp. CB1015 TaxID=2976822 RepID=UPI0021AA010B|nr:hypothetical protein [Bradyrhizobium sp. CB1015]UWU89364.1 hypothetical protein N2604_22950 [Bradyrhizobium sp. CB1015]